MYSLWYQCSYRPVWYELDQPFWDLAAAIRGAIELSKARGGCAVQVQTESRKVLFQWPGNR
jgi:hypothetical protein